MESPAVTARAEAGPHAPAAAAEDPLFPPVTRQRALDTWLASLLNSVAAQIGDGPVDATQGQARADGLALPPAPSAASAARNIGSWDFAAWDFSRPVALEEVTRWVVHEMQRGIVQVSHPRYFGLFNPTPAHPSRCADMISAVFNAQLASATTSPFPVALERYLIQCFGARAGLPQAAGHFTNGGSEANGAALTCALTAALPDFARCGARGFAGQPVFYCSADAHLAWLKLAHQSGIGRAALHLVQTDGTGRMDADLLDAAIARDRLAGRVPVMIVSTAGSTGGGMIDPLHKNSAIARRHGVWHHVDAAWGGGALACDHHRHILDGIETADSITIDAHKWLATTMGCGMFITRHQQITAQAFHASMECMPSCDMAADPYVTSAQWSRRFIGLRLFMNLAAGGWAGYGRHIERALSQADWLAHALQEEGWSLINHSPLAVLCLRPPPQAPAPAAIARAVLRSGAAWISAGHFETIPVLRICITSGRTSAADLRMLVAALRTACG